MQRVTVDGIIETVAGTGKAGYEGDGRPGTSAKLNRPTGVAVDLFGNILIADSDNGSIRKVNRDGIIDTMVRGPSNRAPSIDVPVALTADAFGNIYFADWGKHQVGRISPSGVITILAGNGLPGYSGDRGPGSQGQLNFPTGIAVDASGTVYIADQGNNRIRIVSPDGTLDTLAGTGDAGYAGDGEPAALARLWNPSGVALDSAGNLYIADTTNNRVRVISPDGIIRTLAGPEYGFHGPRAVVVSSTDVAFVVDQGNLRVVAIEPVAQWNADRSPPGGR